MAAKARILFIVGGGRFFGEELPLGGAASYLKAAALALPAERVEPGFLFLFSGPTVDEFASLGFRCRTASRRFRGDPALLVRIARAIRQERPDLVVTAVSNANLYGRLAAKMAGAPRIATVIMDYMQGIMAAEKPRPVLERISLWQERLLWRLNRAVITPSTPLREHLIREWKVPAERVVSIPGAVDTSQPPPAAEEVAAARERLGAGPAGAGPFLAGTMCRLAPVKNIPMLLRAARRVEQEAPGKALFAVAGEGPQRQALEERARAMGIGRTVRFAGWWHAAAAFAAAADLHLLTSYTESQGISLLEAMAASRPVVATAAGGVTEVVEDRVTGFLVDHDDDEAMARHILELMRDPDLARRMGAAGRRRVEVRFSLGQVRAGFERLMHRLGLRVADA